MGTVLEVHCQAFLIHPPFRYWMGCGQSQPPGSHAVLRVQYLSYRCDFTRPATISCRGGQPSCHRQSSLLFAFGEKRGGRWHPVSPTAISGARLTFSSPCISLCCRAQSNVSYITAHGGVRLHLPGLMTSSRCKAAFGFLPRHRAWLSSSVTRF